MNTTVTLHCKPYVKHWLVKQFGFPVRFPRRSNDLEIFSACCEKHFYPSSDYNKEKYSAQVEIQINEHDQTIHGNFVRKSLHHYINRYFEHRIDLELFMFVFASEVNNTGINSGIHAYRMLMGFEDEIISFDTLEKRYDRFKKKLTNKIFSTSVPKKINHVPAIT